jgi:hypothetical protein
MWRKTQITDDTAKLKGFLGATPHLIVISAGRYPRTARCNFSTQPAAVRNRTQQQMLARSPAYTTVFERLTCKSLGM